MKINPLFVFLLLCWLFSFFGIESVISISLPADSNSAAVRAAVILAKSTKIKQSLLRTAVGTDYFVLFREPAMIPSGEPGTAKTHVGRKREKSSGLGPKQ